MSKETYYKTCEKCGANLDPGERCDCDRDKGDVLYICDRQKCKNCTHHCKHTSDIKHAVNFKKEFDTYYVERPIVSKYSGIFIIGFELNGPDEDISTGMICELIDGAPHVIRSVYGSEARALYNQLLEGDP